MLLYSIKKLLNTIVGIKQSNNKVAPYSASINMTENAIFHFGQQNYHRINQRRLEHLASLHLPLENASVLEVGAGTGDLTSFFLDRHCNVVVSEVRPENLAILRQRYPTLEIIPLDLDNPPDDLGQQFDIVFCYGVLYHLSQPANALAFLSRHCRQMLLLETCVSYGQQARLNPCAEDKAIPTQAFHGIGCRPTRLWVYQKLSEHFKHIYLPRTQPYHPQFPCDWTKPNESAALTRAIFIASHVPIENPFLTSELLDRQTHHIDIIPLSHR
jgi:SAM-dependent methyltransferase